MFYNFNSATEELFETLGLTWKSKLIPRLNSVLPTGEKLYEVYHKGIVVLKGSKKEVEELAEKLKGMGEGAAEKYLDDLVEEVAKGIRKSAFAKWAEKFDSTFFNHLDGDLGLETIELGFQKQEYIGLGQGGHNPNALGKSIKIREGTITIPNPPIDDLPFKAKIEVKYKNGEWVPKTAESTLFPKNWSLERIQEEVTFVYGNTVAIERELLKTKIIDGKIIQQYLGETTSRFKIIVEVNESKQIINSYPF